MIRSLLKRTKGPGETEAGSAGEQPDQGSPGGNSFTPMRTGGRHTAYSRFCFYSCCFCSRPTSVNRLPMPRKTQPRCRGQAASTFQRGLHTICAMDAENAKPTQLPSIHQDTTPNRDNLFSRVRASTPAMSLLIAAPIVLVLRGELPSIVCSHLTC